MLYLFRVLSVFFLFFFFQNASSSTVSGTLVVTANVGGPVNCVLGGAANMLFPNYSAFNVKSDVATSSLSINCSANLPYDIGINQGEGAGATEAQRKVTLIGGRQELKYNLFQDANHVYPYGTIIGQNTLHQLGTGSPQLITIHGEIPNHQLSEIGSYTDRVTIFVTF